MGTTRLNKQILGDYLESQCERQLFLHLGEGNEKWVDPLREIEPLNRKLVGNLITKLGEKYENEIYNNLIKNNHNRVLINHDWKERTSKVQLTTEFFNTLYKKLINEEENPRRDFCLLEYDFKTPEVFIRHLLKLPPDQNIPINYSETLRPDILLFGNNIRIQGQEKKAQVHSEEDQIIIGELLPDGNIRNVPKEELQTRIGISIFDVKLSRPDSIGKKYFFEVLFYCIALVHFLHEKRLNDKFFVRVDNNGIFPRYSDIQDLKISDIRIRAVEMPFKDTYILYESLSNQIQEFLDIIPCAIEDIPLNLQSICARCKYIEDCKKTLNCDPGIPRQKWNLQLLPYTSQTISEQLKDSINPKYETIQDVFEKIETHPSEIVPTPLYAEKPFLKVRAESLLKEAPIKPELGQLYSISIPKYSPISLIIDFETDPIHNVVCAVSFYLSSIIFDNQKQYKNFVRWWTIWNEFLENPDHLDRFIKEINQRFDPEVKNPDIVNVQSFLKEFAASLKLLHSNRQSGKKNKNWIELDKEAKSGVNYSKFDLAFSLVNMGLSERDENIFSEKVISLLYAIVVFIQGLEWFIVSNGKYLNSAIFYWSQEQIDYIEEFLERNLEHLTDDAELRRKTLYILKWFNPSESDVKNPYHAKKFYDLKAFAETTMSFPLIINYTWHEIASYLSTMDKYKPTFGYKEQTFYEIFWNPHFNFIDFQQWYRFLNKSGAEKSTLLSDLRRQMIKKVRTLDRLRQIFQKEGRSYLLGHNKPKSMEEFYDFDLPEDYHNIAHIWNLFENYTTTYEEFEADKIRCLYPNFGVGKLESAKIEKITQFVEYSNGHKNYYYQFHLKGVSSNVKMDETDWVICVPELLRNIPRWKNSKWDIVIDEIRWKGNFNEVRTQPWSTNILSNYLKELQNVLPYTRENSLRNQIVQKIDSLEKKIQTLDEKGKVDLTDTFYLYKRASNPWSGKLKDLLENYNYGESWLGKVLAFKWNLTRKKRLMYPDPFPYACWLPEVYMYAPNLLPSYENSVRDLMTAISPPPDPSQKKAIKNALKYTIYGIQGPPGTGKTQTVATLVDEFILQNRNRGKEGPVRVLVMAYSYAALRVVFEKIINSHTDEGGLTEAAKSRFVYLRSKHREPPSFSRPFYDIHKKNRKTMIVRKVNGDQPGLFVGEITQESNEKLEDLLEMNNKDIIMFANAHYLAKLNDTYYGRFKFIKKDFAFDLIVVDESSQVPVNHMLAAFQYVKNFQVKVVLDSKSGLKEFPDGHEGDEDYKSSGNYQDKSGKPIKNIEDLSHLRLESATEGTRIVPESLTKVVIVGDQNQLPPVQQVKPPKKLESILDNLFGYYADYHHIPNDQLEFNYRSHLNIVDFTNYMEIYRNEINALSNREKKIGGDLGLIQDWIQAGNNPELEPWVLNVLNPDIIVGALIHQNKFETAVSPLEVKLVTQLILGYYLMNMPDRTSASLEELQSAQRNFWTEKLGVVAPHNAQGRLIIRNIHELLVNNDLNDLDDNELMAYLKQTVYSVEKFQGSARDFIIASIGISAQDQLLSEEEFIYDLNRFNVLSSRARAKFVLICSQNYLNYIPNDQELMQTAAKIRRFALNYCSEEKIIEIRNDKSNKKEIKFHFRK
ncbi:MAG: AAA domain-containing protein [Candidatus Lokiarchaeota archaeon]